MKIHIVNDPWGDWCQFFVDGELKHEGHSVRDYWYEEILEKLNVEITSEEKCLDDSHSDCDCQKIKVKIYEAATIIASYSVYTLDDGKFLGYVDSEYSRTLDYDENGHKPKEEILIDIKEVIE